MYLVITSIFSKLRVADCAQAIGPWAPSRAGVDGLRFHSISIAPFAINSKVCCRAQACAVSTSFDLTVVPVLLAAVWRGFCFFFAGGMGECVA